MTAKRLEFIELVRLAAERSAMRKAVFSRPVDSEVSKVSARLCSHRGKAVIAFEYSLPGDTVSQKNLSIEDALGEMETLLLEYGQANLITSVSDVEFKLSKKGGEVILGGDRLRGRLASYTPEDVGVRLAPLEKEKNYILSGKEEFLLHLGISDKSGRVHDKKQGKYRQINRFLEHIEAVYRHLRSEGELVIYDLCCGKSYLSFAVYYYLTEIKKRSARLIGIDLKRDVIEYCAKTARECGFDGMSFIYGDVRNAPRGTVDMVISLHACDVATDIVIDTAAELGAEVIISTPCCHRYLTGKVSSSELKFVTGYPHLANKLCEALTDSLRALRLEARGYAVSVCELTDPENTPKNTLIRAVRREASKEKLEAAEKRYRSALDFLLGDGASEYLADV